jgi:8-oxo-dGTP diphosphatase
MTEADGKPVVRVVAGLMEDSDGRVLITQRRPQAFMPLKWEFPGGKVEQGETDEQALARELLEELGIQVEVGQHFMDKFHVYDDFAVDFNVYRCHIQSGDLRKIAVNDFVWVKPSDLDCYEFPPADEPTIERLID